MIRKQAFGRTGQQSSCVIFGAAALGSMGQEKADKILDLLLEYGVNHIDTAAIYGESEARLGPWMKQYRDRFFLASKTGDRTYAAAKESLHRSLERMGTDHLDLLQLHNLVDPTEWETALAPGGALEALLEARAQGLVRYLGVTGHGVHVAERHRQSLERYAFDSVLLPYNYTMMRIPEYAQSFESLLAICASRGVAVQTIKSVARRRWGDAPGKRFSWYEPLKDPDAIDRAVRYVLGRPGIFLNSSSDTTILPLILRAAANVSASPSSQELERDIAAFSMQPLFPPGVDAI